MSRALALLTAAFAALALAVAGHVSPAQAADSHAPHGARADWLPSAEWVMSSWLPYDATRLYALAHTDRDELGHWLDDRRSLGALARRHGVHSLDGLAAALVAPRRAHVPPATFRALRRHAMDTLTQPHLARHVLFHVNHTPALVTAAPRVFGLRAETFRALRNQGLTPLAIAARAGRAPAVLGDALMGFFAGRAERAVATGASSRAQAAALLELQRAGLARFARTHYRTPAQQQRFACDLHVY